MTGGSPQRYVCMPCRESNPGAPGYLVLPERGTAAPVWCPWCGDKMEAYTPEHHGPLTGESNDGFSVEDIEGNTIDCAGCDTEIAVSKDTHYRVVEHRRPHPQLKKASEDLEFDDFFSRAWFLCRSCTGETLDAVDTVGEEPVTDGGVTTTLPAEYTRELARKAATAEGLDCSRTRLADAHVTADGELALTVEASAKGTERRERPHRSDR